MVEVKIKFYWVQSMPNVSTRRLLNIELGMKIAHVKGPSACTLFCFHIRRNVRVEGDEKKILRKGLARL